MAWQICTLCIFKTFTKCSNYSCKNAVCSHCKRNKNYLCQACKANGVSFVPRNRLTRSKKRKAETSAVGEPEPTRAFYTEYVEPIPSESSGRESQENESYPSLSPSNNETSDTGNNGNNEMQCEVCSETFVRLIYHLKKRTKIDCKTHYLGKYKCDNLNMCDVTQIPVQIDSFILMESHIICSLFIHEPHMHEEILNVWFH